MTRRLLALAGLGLTALMLQSAAASLLPASLVPDFVLLVAVAAAVVAPAVEGLLLAVGVGYGADLLSGALFGHHALLRVCVWAATRGVSAQLHLQRPLPLAVFVVFVTVLDAAGTAALSWIFTGELALGLHLVTEVLTRALLNAVMSRVVYGVLVAVLELLVDREPRHRDVRLDTRRPVL